MRSTRAKRGSRHSGIGRVADIRQSASLTDSHGNILEGNEPASQLLNLSRKFVLGKPLSLFLPRDRGQFTSRLAEIPIVGFDAWPLQIRPREKKRIWVTATVRVSEVADDGVTLHWLLKEIEAIAAV